MDNALKDPDKFVVSREVTTASSEMCIYDNKTKSRINYRDKSMGGLKIDPIGKNNNNFLLSILYNRISSFKGVIESGSVYVNVDNSSLEITGYYKPFVCKTTPQHLIFTRYVPNETSFSSIVATIKHKFKKCPTKSSVDIPESLNIHVFKDSMMYCTVNNTCYSVESRGHNIYPLIRSLVDIPNSNESDQVQYQQQCAVRYGCAKIYYMVQIDSIKKSDACHNEYSILMKIGKSMCIVKLDGKTSWYNLLFTD